MIPRFEATALALLAAMWALAGLLLWTGHRLNRPVPRGN